MTNITDLPLSVRLRLAALVQDSPIVRRETIEQVAGIVDEFRVPPRQLKPLIEGLVEQFEGHRFDPDAHQFLVAVSRGFQLGNVPPELGSD